MDVRGDRPAHLACGHCGAATAVSWRLEGDGLWQAMGRCPSCCWTVHSFLVEDLGVFEDLLSAFVSTFPDPHLTFHFGSPKPARTA
jgi:hypothetical protein